MPKWLVKARRFFVRPMHPPLQRDARGARADVGIDRDSPQPLDLAQEFGDVIHLDLGGEVRCGTFDSGTTLLGA